MPTLQAKVLYETDISDKAIVEIFHILEEEDPMLFCQWEASLKQLKIHIMGKIQLEILKAAVLKRFGVEITFAQPQVVYLETISGPVTGHGHFEPLRHYAEVAVRLEPGVLGSGITFSSECHVDTLALNFQNLIKTHVFEKKHRGVLTGSELTDIHIILIWGRAHIKHTEGGDFREALYRAIRQGLMKADSLILEPYYAFTIKIAQEHVGRVIDVYKRKITDCDKLYKQLYQYMEQSQPETLKLLKFYDDPLLPLDKLYSLEEAVEKALSPKVWLKSGGYLVIEYTEALTVIDVNTGKYDGKKTLPETIMKINLEAAEEIGRQLRLRNLSGIIIVDFIDMSLEEDRNKLMKCLNEICARDQVKTTVVDITPLNLVEITRKKIRRPLHEQAGLH